MKLNGTLTRELFNALTAGFVTAGHTVVNAQILAMAAVNAIEQHPNLKLVTIGTRKKVQDGSVAGK